MGVELTDKQKWWCIGQRRELAENYDQEYPYNAESAFAAVRDGAYFAVLWKKHGRRYTNDLKFKDVKICIQ